ncbi:MAG: hypothetical protein CMG63_02905 [Candidatus Marinimicrobia bacterium]|nr:hypothetical protein [Candidatus Neomarinimicrobiota bacterium]
MENSRNIIKGLKMNFDKNKKVSVLIAARMGSSRFPGKTLSDLHGKPMLYRLIERVKKSDKIDEIVVATTKEVEDDELEIWCDQNFIKIYRGSSSDVLKRLNDAALYYKMQTIVEVLGDNPLVHAKLIDSCLELFENGYDYVATVTNEYPNAEKSLMRFPIGVRVQVMSISTILKCEQLTKLSRHREHATSFIAENPKLFKTGFLEAKGFHRPSNWPELTFAVNERKNLELIRKIYEIHYEKNDDFSVNDAVKACESISNFKALMGS